MDKLEDGRLTQAGVFCQVLDGGFASQSSTPSASKSAVGSTVASGTGAQETGGTQGKQIDHHSCALAC
jgi:hypothetical protein